MIRDFTLHGELGEKIAYYATIVGRNLDRELYSFELGGREDPFAIRFFSRGQELTLQSEGVAYRGTGGSLCEYMFGVDLPYDDLTKSDVCNRLTLHGALEDLGGEGLRFTARTEGRESYDSVFLNGNAVTNYFYFVSPADPKLQVFDIQRELLRLAGKKLKRLPLGRDRAAVLSEVAHSLLEWMIDYDPTVFVVQLVHKVHGKYAAECHKEFLEHHDLAGPREVGLVARAQALGIDQYTRERIKIDTIYRHPDNKLVIDEYKKLLVEASTLPIVPPELVARLARLRTLSVRRRIPEVILKKLDYRFPLQVVGDERGGEPDYLGQIRSVLEGLFLSARTHGPLEPGDLETLIRAKHRASLTRDAAFEGLLLETGRRIDEASGRGETHLSGIEHFSTIITYFDRYDACGEMVNRLAFIGESSLASERVRSLRNHREAFDQVRPGLFEECFFEPVSRNLYLSAFGRQKIAALRETLSEMAEGDVTAGEAARRLDAIALKEKHYNLLTIYFRNNLKLVSLYKSGEPIEAIHQKVNSELFVRGLIKEMLPIDRFHTALQHVLEEDLYTNEVLPEIIDRKNEALRIDFFENSGLDLFRIEELEKEYLERNRLPVDTLAAIETLSFGPKRRARAGF